jgi:hypothetical protein
MDFSNFVEIDNSDDEDYNDWYVDES